MPRIEDISDYLRGIWLLVLGDRKGLSWLDNSADGVLRSFLAFVWCLPAMAIGWSGARMYYLANMPDGTPAGVIFVLKLLLVDIAAWGVPLLLVAILSRALGYTDILADVIVATNWLSVPALYASAFPSAISLVIPGSGPSMALVALLILMFAIAATYRLLKTIVGDHWLLATTLTMLFILPSLMVADLLQRALGVTPV